MTWQTPTTRERCGRRRLASAHVGTSPARPPAHQLRLAEAGRGTRQAAPERTEQRAHSDGPDSAAVRENRSVACYYVKRVFPSNAETYPRETKPFGSKAQRSTKQAFADWGGDPEVSAQPSHRRGFGNRAEPDRVGAAGGTARGGSRPDGLGRNPRGPGQGTGLVKTVWQDHHLHL